MNVECASGAHQIKIWGKKVPGREKSFCQGNLEEAGLVYLKEYRVAIPFSSLTHGDNINRTVGISWTPVISVTAHQQMNESFPDPNAPLHQLPLSYQIYICKNILLSHTIYYSFNFFLTFSFFFGGGECYLALFT